MIFVAFVCIFLASRQVAAVVNNGQSAKIEDSNKSISETTDTDKSSSSNEADAVAASTEDKTNRREGPLHLGDTYGSPLATPADSYLPSGPNNNNLPVPVYGVPDAPSNNIVYPTPSLDIPPPVSLPLPSYGLPLTSNSYGAPAVTNYLPPPSNNYGPPAIKFESATFNLPKFSGPGRGTKPTYGPPRFQYGPPGKPLFTSKFASKHPYKSNFGVYKPAKPLTAYGPPSAYFKDNYSPSKFNFKFNNVNLLSNGNNFDQSSFSNNFKQQSLGSHSLISQYAIPNVGYGIPNIGYGVSNVGIQSHSNNINLLGNNGNSISSQYGVPDVSVQILSTTSGHGAQSIATQYGAPDGNILGVTKSHYGPPQPSSHPKPPHPGVPAPPTPPDIKYDGWKPIPGLVSRVPSASYGAPHGDNHGVGDPGYNKDLIPPPLELQGDHHQQSSSAYGAAVSLSSVNSYGGSQGGVSDSYGAPLNTVTGSGGVVSSSGEEVHGQHLSNAGAIDIDIGQNVNTVKSIGIDIYPSGSGSIGGQAHTSSGYNFHYPDTYSAPPLNSYSTGGPYAAAHSYNNIGSSSLGFGSHNSHGSYNFHNSHNSFNSHKSHGHKGLSLSNSGRGLIPPSGIYGLPPSGQYGTPLFTNAPHGSSLNALKINPPKHPVVHREPVPPGIFDSITKQTAHKHNHGHTSHNQHSFSSTYLPPPVADISRPTKEYTPPAPSTLYSLPNAHSPISFQNVAYGSSSSGLLHQNLNLNIEESSAPALSSYNAPLNIVDGSYNLPHAQSHTHSHLNSEVVGIDLSHPGLTIDLTGNGGAKSGFSLPHDCSLHKTQSLPSLSYGVPSANSYTASLSSLTTNIRGAQGAIALPQTSYGVPEVNSGPAVQISYEVSEPHSSELRDNYDLSAAHSQKVSSEAKVNSIENETEGKSYGKFVAKSFGSNSELIQSQNIDLNNIGLQGALGSYTLQIQSADGGQGEVPHGQVLNDGLLQSILAAIEQPQQNGDNSIGRPIIQLQKSLEQQNFVTNDTISSVVGQIADSQIEHSSPLQYVVEPSNEVQTKVEEVDGETQITVTQESPLPLLEDNGIALYFSNNQRSKKETDEDSFKGDKSIENTVHNSH
ncbi:hypothetical protein NQ314_009116 [Rhamnusium bicolor]|uniref:Uncharacterized protein n=1 Tax=Rhamnusium bicolor TaxID=1586634 RepID=A0AAV8Y4H4_9CUCU|nr:hypothetical protein NQ314_009116 [Rhamnusium bicolor]